MLREPSVIVREDVGDCDAGGIGAEHVRGRVAGLLLARGQRDDLGDPPRPLSPARRDLGLQAQLDDQVDGRRELAGRETLRDVRTRLHRAGHELAYGGHGVGREMHGDPHVSNDGRPGRGIPLRPGLVIAIEPWFLATTHEIYTDPDGWTLRSADGSRGAHSEHTIAITDADPIVLTARPD